MKGYSTKNIPIPSRKVYLKCLISKAESFIRNVRWKTFFFLNPEIKGETKETYGFKSSKSPPRIHELKEFEDGILGLVQNIEFKNPNSNNNLQKQLSSDVQKIKKDDKLYVPADKTTNFYKVSPDKYNDLMQQNINKDYKKTSTKSVRRQADRRQTGHKRSHRHNSTK